MPNALLCLFLFDSFSLSLFPLSLSLSLSQGSVSLTCTRTHTHLFFLLCSFASSSLSYPLKEHRLSFCSRTFPYLSTGGLRGYFEEGVQVLDHISGGWETLIVFLCFPCDLPAVTELMVHRATAVDQCKQQWAENIFNQFINITGYEMRITSLYY